MPLYRFDDGHLRTVTISSLAAQQVRERQDLQRALRENIEILGDDLLVVAEEYDLFEDSRRRIDLLAVDRTGTLVVIELKRTLDGGHMELQAIRYAAMVSTMTLDQLVAVSARWSGRSIDDARSELDRWVDEPIVELANRVRIILVSGDFKPEITSTVIWLTQTYGFDISCFRMVVYAVDGHTLVDIQQIIPVPESKDFQIQQRRKEVSAVVRSTPGRDYTRYDVTIDGEEHPGLSKQSAIKLAVQRLARAGVPLRHVQAATNARRWVGLQPRDDETLLEAFARQYPGRSGGHMWFDLGIEEDGTHWIMPRFGGTDTEQMLGALTSAAATTIGLAWHPADDEPAGSPA